MEDDGSFSLGSDDPEAEADFAAMLADDDDGCGPSYLEPAGGGYDETISSFDFNLLDPSPLNWFTSFNLLVRYIDAVSARWRKNRVAEQYVNIGEGLRTMIFARGKISPDSYTVECLIFFVGEFIQDVARHFVPGYVPVTNLQMKTIKRIISTLSSNLLMSEDELIYEFKSTNFEYLWELVLNEQAENPVVQLADLSTNCERPNVTVNGISQKQPGEAKSSKAL